MAITFAEYFRQAVAKAAKILSNII